MISEIKNQDVKFECSDGAQMNAYLSAPGELLERGGKSPAVIIIHEAYGLNEQIKGVNRRYAEQGFVAIAPNLFARNGDVMNEKNVESAMKPIWSIPPEKRGDRETIQNLMKQMPEAERKVVEIFFFGRETLEKQMANDLLNCKDFLVGLDYVQKDKLGVTGFCMGGGLAFQVSTMYRFGASVPFYGANPKPLESVANIAGPVLALYAGEDTGINVGVSALVGEMIKQKKQFEMKLYKGTQHAFFNETRPVYNKAASEDAWRNTIEFFNKHLKNNGH